MARSATSRPPAPHRALAAATAASKAPAIARAAAVLRFLGKSEHPVGVHAIARELGLVPSTCLHVLRALVAEELVAFDPQTKRYALDAGVLTLARQWLRRNRFTDLARPILDQVGERHQVTVLGVRIVGLDHIVVVALSQSGPDLHLSAQIGSRFPALISATGRCIAAFGDYPEEEIAARFHALRWDDPPSYEDWCAEVLEARRRGVALDRGHYISGVTVIAAPVWDGTPQPNHALVAIGIGGALQRQGSAQLEDDLLEGALALTRQLAGEPGVAQVE